MEVEGEKCSKLGNIHMYQQFSWRNFSWPLAKILTSLILMSSFHHFLYLLQPRVKMCCKLALIKFVQILESVTNKHSNYNKLFYEICSTCKCINVFQRFHAISKYVQILFPNRFHKFQVFVMLATFLGMCAFKKLNFNFAPPQRHRIVSFLMPTVNSSYQEM